MEGYFCKPYNSRFSNRPDLGEINSDEETSVKSGNMRNSGKEIRKKIVQGKVKEKCVIKIEKLQRSSKIKEKDSEGDVVDFSETKVEDLVNSNPLYNREDFELRSKDNNETNHSKSADFSVTVDLVNNEITCRKYSPISVSSKETKNSAKEKVSRNIFSERVKVGSEYETESVIESETESETSSNSSQEISKRRTLNKTGIRKLNSPKPCVTYGKDRCFLKKNQKNVPVSPRIRPGSSIIDIATGKNTVQPSTSKDSFTKPLDVVSKAKRKSPEVSSTTGELTLKRKRSLGSDDGESCIWSDDEGICNAYHNLASFVQF